MKLTSILSFVFVFTLMFLHSCGKSCDDTTCYDCKNPDMPECDILICSERIQKEASCSAGASINIGVSGSCNNDLKKIVEADGYTCVKR